MAERQSFGLPQLRVPQWHLPADQQDLQRELEHAFTEYTRQVERYLQLLAERIDVQAGVRGVPKVYNDLVMQGHRVCEVGEGVAPTDVIQRQQTIARSVTSIKFDAQGLSIQNLQSGVEDADAVNVRQLHEMGTGAAPIDASYVVIALSPALTQERQLTIEATVLSLTDAGANNTVTIGVATNGITFAKIQQIATDRLLGRDTAATGNVEEVTVGGGVEFTGAGGIQRSALTGDVTAAAGGTVTTIAANAVLDTMLRDSAAVSVIGRSAGSAGDPADIAAAANTDVLRRASDVLGFGTISVAGGYISDAVPGTYTPTLTNVTNLDASTAYECQYVRVGTIVMVSGLVDVDPTTGGGTATELGVSLPVASTFGATEDCGGVATASGVQESAAIVADAANNRAKIVWVTSQTANTPMSFTFTYAII